VWLGQGWNSGVRDAMNLGWKLASVLSGQAGDDLLDTYTDERLPHATQMVKLSMAMGHVIKLTNPVAVAARDLAGKVINRVPRARDYFGEMRFRPQPRYTRGVLADQSTQASGVSDVRLTTRSIPFLQTRDKTSSVGVQFPQPRVTTKDARDVRLDDVTGTWWSVLLWINNPYGVLPKDTLDTLATLGARLVTVVPENQRSWCEEHFPSDVVVVGDHTGRLKAWFDTRPVGVVILRPDHFVAGACLAQQTPQTLDAILASMSFTAAPTTAPTRTP